MRDLPILESVTEDRYEHWQVFADQYEPVETRIDEDRNSHLEQISKAADGWCWWARESPRCDTRRARKILTYGNHGIGVKVANDYYRIKVNNRHPLSREDFVGKALEGLWEVSDEWDYKAGASFSTYSAKALRSSYLEPMRLNNTREIASANAQRRAESQEASQDAVYTEEDTFLKRHTVDKLQAPRGENRTLLDKLEKPESIDHGDLVDTVESFREFVYDIVDSPNSERDAAVYLESLTGSPGRGGYIKPRSPPNVRLAEKHDLSSERIRQIKEYVSDRVKAERDKFIDSQRGKPL